MGKVFESSEKAFYHKQNCIYEFSFGKGNEMKKHLIEGKVIDFIGGDVVYTVDNHIMIAPLDEILNPKISLTTLPLNLKRVLLRNGNPEFVCYCDRVLKLFDSEIKPVVEYNNVVKISVISNSLFFTRNDVICKVGDDNSCIEMVGKKNLTKYDISNNKIAMGMKSGKISIYNIDRKSEYSFHWHNSPINLLEFTEDENCLYSVSSRKNVVYEYSLRTKQGKVIFDFEGAANSLVASKTFLILECELSVYIFNLKTGTLSRNITF